MIIIFYIQSIYNAQAICRNTVLALALVDNVFKMLSKKISIFEKCFMMFIKFTHFLVPLFILINKS